MGLSWAFFFEFVSGFRVSGFRDGGMGFMGLGFVTVHGLVAV